MLRFDKFFEGKSKIVTMSYDDAQLHDLKLIEIFNRYKIKGTFHINSGGLDKDGYVSKQDIKSVYKGHEVSLHTCSHPFLNHVPNETFVNEIMENRRILEGATGEIIKGMSYPYGAYDDVTVQKLKGLGVIYARTTGSTKTFKLPTDFMKWNPSCHHNDGLELSKRFLSLLGRKDHHHLLYIWGHSYEFNQDDNWDLIEDICQMLSNHEDIWYATNIEIYNYMVAQRRLVISADQKIIFNPSAQTVWISADRQTVKISGGETVRL